MATKNNLIGKLTNELNNEEEKIAAFAEIATACRIDFTKDEYTRDEARRLKDYNVFVRQQNDSTKEEFDRRMNNGESIDEIFKSFRSRLLKTEKAERIDNAELDKIMKEAGELVATQVLQTLADDGKLALAAARRAMVKKLTDPNFVQLLIAEQPKAILSELTDGPFALGPSGETIDVEGEPNDG